MFKNELRCVVNAYAKLSSAKNIVNDSFQINTTFSLLTLILTISFYSNQILASDEKELATPITIATVKSKTFEESVKEVGKINSIDSANLTFNAGAKLKAVFFNNGDHVVKGQIIAELDDIKATAELDKAKSALALAKTKLERVRDLLKKSPDALSKQDVDELKENVNLADADYRQKQAIMDDYLIKAPFDGRLTSYSQSVGSYIGSGTSLIAIYSLNPVEVRYSISQNDFGKAKKGQLVEVSVEAYPGMQFTGKVNYVAPAVDSASGRVEVSATLENPEHLLAPGMFANIKQFYGNSFTRLLVPQNSIIAHNDERFVWLVKNDRAFKQPVKIENNTNTGFTVIAAGLTEGDVIVETGMQNLKDNALIKVVMELAPGTHSQNNNSESNSEKNKTSSSNSTDNKSINGVENKAENQ